MNHRLTVFSILALGVGVPAPASADLSLKNFTATVSGTTVTYGVEACVNTSYGSTTTVGVYYDLPSAPTKGQSPNQSVGASPSQGVCQKVSLVRANTPVGLYRSYAKIDPFDKVPEASEQNNVVGPKEVCVGPDLLIESFTVEKSGASVTYKVKVCNRGSLTARKFRVGIWHNRSTAPPATHMGDIFKGIASLGPNTCTKLTISGGLRPNGTFRAWARADSGDFVTECRETNNPKGPVGYTLANPDLAVTSFSASVSSGTVTYSVRVCNKGVVAVDKFYVDLYYNRTKKAPSQGDPGDDVAAVSSLAPSVCTGLTFTRVGAADGSYTSYAQADADNFVSEPNEANNLSDPLTVVVGRGSGSKGSCTDSDGDGYGVGAGCSGAPDCNDKNKAINPAAKEICGDGIDQDCDLTPDDGCPGVDCVDHDGDGFGVGKGCVLADCDDHNKAVYPWAKETCGNHKDDNCNKIVDDGCPGVDCVDRDGDGYGVGADCQGVPDCNDADYKVNPAAKEICGDKIDQDCDLTPDDGCVGVRCTDHDGDGFGVGPDCVLSDCDDNNAKVYPWAPETCGDNLDDNCNKIADDGCKGRQCRDRDADGFGVGKGCPGAQDCDDKNHFVHPGAKEVCGDGTDNDCNGVTDDGCASASDNDGDGDKVGGATPGLWDCNDKNAKVGPSQKEICGDGIDNDCDGTVDDGCPGVKCTDGDGDGWGTGVDCKLADCDDKNGAVYPYATEVCGDHKDNNCNGQVDEGCPGRQCQDKDHDTFGAGAGCCPSGATQCKVDCDDTDAGVNPWAKEICADGKDNDCDKQVDEGCLLCEDRDSDGYGIGPKCSSWDCDDSDPTAFPGAQEVCNGKDTNCNGKVDDNCTGGDGGCAVARGSGGSFSGGVWVLLGLLLLGVARRRRG